MKRFHFPLDRVRLWRVEQAEFEATKLQGLVEQLAALAQEKARIAEDRAQSHRRIVEQKIVEPRDLQALDAYRWLGRGRIGQIENRSREISERAQQQRERTIEARRKAELLERLKQKKFDEWRTAADREEETLAAELHLAKRIRRRSLS